MTTTIKEALEVFMEYSTQMDEALKTLREAVKEQVSDSIQHYINEENFEKVNEIISELNVFTHMEYTSNAQDIYDFANKIIQNQPEAPHKTKKKTITDISIVKEPRNLKEKEKELMKTIGYTSLSRLSDTNEPFEEELVISLIDKGYLEGEKIQSSEGELLVFEFSAKGKKEFEDTYGIKPNESLKSQLKNKYGSLSLGFFLFDIENAFQNRNYQVNEVGVHQIEVLKEKRYTYLTPDMGQFSENDYFKVLDRKNQLKNIGFVSIDEASMELAQEATKKWTKKNQEKCKFLTVHFTNMEKMVHELKVFDVIRF